MIKRSTSSVLLTLQSSVEYCADRCHHAKLSMNAQQHSPFFTRRARSPTASISRTTSSPHFVRSPSSTYGSLQGRSNVMVDVMELPFQRDDKHVEDQFGMCPHFQASDSCQPVSVRHLCKSACYLRAFAPTREWHYLRKAIMEFSDESPGKCSHILSDCIRQLVLCAFGY